MPTADKLLVQVAADIRDLKSNLSQAQKEISKFTSGAEKDVGGFKGVFAGVFSAAIVVDFAKQAAKAITEFVKDSVKEFADFETKYTAFTDMLGAQAENVFGRLQDAAKGTASSLDLITSSNKALLLGIKANDLPVLFEASRKLGLAMGRTATEAFDDITVGIGRQSKLILDNLGIVVSADQAYKNYAATVGKTADQLTDAEKKTAFYGEAMAQLLLKSATLSDQNDSMSATFQRFNASVTDLKISIGEALVPAVKDASDVMEGWTYIIQGVADAMNETAKSSNKTVSVFGEISKYALVSTLTGGIGQMVYLFGKLGKAAKDSADNIRETNPDLKSYADAMKEDQAVQEALVSSGAQVNSLFNEFSKEIMNAKQGGDEYNSSVNNLEDSLSALGISLQIAFKVNEEFKKSMEETATAVDQIKELTDEHDRAVESLRIKESYLREELIRNKWEQEKLTEVIKQQTDVLDKYKKQLEDTKNAIDELLNPLFTGQRLNEEQIWQLQQLIKQQQKNMLWMDKESDEYKDSSERLDFLNTKLAELRLGYDLSYGQMQHDVELHAQSHEDAARDIYDSSTQVILALDQQWQAETRLQMQIANQEAVIAQTEAARQSLVDDAKEIQHAIEEINLEIMELDRLLALGKRKFEVEVEEIRTTTGGTTTGGTSSAGRSADAGGTGNAATKAASFVHNVFSGGFQEGGMVPQTGMALVHQGEAVIPKTSVDALIKGKAPMSNSVVVNIGTINASNAQEIANEIAARVNSAISW